MDYESIYQEILNGEAILFIGAGFSVGNKSYNGQYKTGKQLANYLCDLVKIKRTDNLNIACSKYLNTFKKREEGITSLMLELKKEFSTKSICDTHEWIIGLPWKRIYTTNYDNLIENASEKIRPKRNTINILKDSKIKKISNSIIHINGYIHDFDEKNEIIDFDNYFKITHESFFKDAFLSSDWKSIFIDDLYEAKKIIFLGYSLEYDFNLQSMIIDEAKNKCIFVDYSNENEDSSDKAYRFEALGQCSFEGVSSFSKKLKEYEGKIFGHVLHENKAFEKITPEKYSYSQLGTVTGNDVFKFFILGKFQEKFINTEDKIIVNRRKKIKNVTEEFENKLIKTIIVHSNLGNGKSIFKHSLMNNLAQNKPVYELISTENLYNEIEKIEEETSSYVEYYIIIDDSGEFMNKMDTLYKKISSRCRVIHFIRTPIKDNLCNQLFKKQIIKPEEMEEVDLNKLDEDELKHVYDIFNTYGYWGNLKTIKMDAHLTYYKNKCKSEFSNLSYFILDSNDIKEKILNIMKEVKKREIIGNFLVADAIASKINIKLNVLQILQVLDININLFFRLIKNPALTDVFDVKGKEVKVLSPIFSDYLLNNFDNEIILKIGAKIYNNSTKIESYDTKYSIRKNLVSRSNIRLITNCNGDLLDDLAISFYDSLRESNVSKENPFYWLQYAISMLNKRSLVEAKRFFDNAYKISYELFRNPDLSHLNTHYSRYLFESELQKSRIDNFDFTNVKEADKLLFIENSNLGSNLKYCLRQIKHYELIFNKFIIDSGNPNWSIEYNKMIDRIIKIAINYFENSKVEKYEIDNQVKTTIREMLPHLKEHAKDSLIIELKSVM